LLLAPSVFLSQATFASAGGTGTCATDGSSYSWTEYVDSTTRTVVTNVCPNHPYYVLNPNVAYGSSSTYTMPASPQLASTTKDLSSAGGGVGLLFNGAFVFSAYGGPQYGQVTSYFNSAPYAEGYTFDQCGCHSSSSTAASYHCHVPPSCLLKQLGQTDYAHSPQIGWMMDGFPIYGPRGSGGALLQSCTVAGLTYGTSAVCVDECNGAGSANGGSDWVSDGFTYRYYILGTYDSTGAGCSSPNSYGTSSELYYPFTPRCLRGCGSGFSFGMASLNTCSGTTTSGLLGSTVPAKAALPANNGNPACVCASLNKGTTSPSSKSSIDTMASFGSFSCGSASSTITTASTTASTPAGPPIKRAEGDVTAKVADPTLPTTATTAKTSGASTASVALGAWLVMGTAALLLLL
jgi:hypothetical protein